MKIAIPNNDDVLELGLRAAYAIGSENLGPDWMRLSHLFARGWRAMPWSYLNRHRPSLHSSDRAVDVWTGQRPAGQMM